MSKILMSLTILVSLITLPAPTNATIVHHCDYTPDTANPGVHDHHDDGGGCSNIDASTEEAYPGTCDHSSGFYWTDMECTGSSCTITGTLWCGPGNTRSYNFTCPGAGARASSQRGSVTCGGDSPQNTFYCDCTMSSCN